MKIFKRVTAAAVSCLLIVSSMAGCKEKAKETVTKLSMGEMIAEAASIENYASEITLHAEGDGDLIDLTANTQTSKKNMEFKNLTIKISSDEDIEIEEDYDTLTEDYSDSLAIDNLDIDMSDPIRLVDGNMFLNLSSILDTVSTASAGMVNIDGEALGVEWISIPADVYNETVETAAKDLSDTLIDACKDIVKSSETKIEEDGDNGYKVTVNDPAQLAKIVEAAATNLETNKESYISKYNALMNSYDFEALTAQYVQLAIEVVKVTCDKVGIVYTEDDLKSLEETITSAIDFSELETMQEESAAEIESAYDELIASLKEAKEDIAETTAKFEATYAVSLEGSKGSRVFNQKMTLDGTNEDGEKFTFSFDSKTTENKTEVKSPDNAKTLADFMPVLLDFAVEQGYVTQDQIDSLSGISLSMILESMNGSALMADDYDYEDYSDDYEYYEEYTDEYEDYADDIENFANEQYFEMDADTAA